MTVAAKTSAPAATTQPRRRGRRPLPAPEPWESELLRLLAEQGAIPFDQLARFLESEDSQAARVAKHLTAVGYADYGRILHDEPPWLWLSWRGAFLSATGFQVGRPKVGAMARMRAVNEVRLHIAARAPEARWVCARSIVREQGMRGYRPNAVVEVGGERHAILVRLRWQEGEYVRDVLETHMARYDAVIAFAKPQPRKQLGRLAAEYHWPKLVIRELPEPP